MRDEFMGKVAVVTGGSSGIGRASARAFAREGAKVVVAADVNVVGGEETVDLIKKSGGEAIFIKTDVSKASEVQALVDRTIETFGRLDYAHNNAAVNLPRLPTAELPESDWDRILNVNLKGVWLCMKYEIPQMLKQGKGAIVNTASFAGLRGAERLSAYSASKHGVVGLTRSAALDYAKSNIRINCVCPASIRTPMIERIWMREPGGEARLTATVPMGRLGIPEEIAEAVVWLCSDAASFVTGLALSVDGGKVQGATSMSMS